MTFAPMNQGQEANLSGKFLEGVIEREFRQRGVHVIRYSEDANNCDLFAPRQLVLDVPYYNSWGNGSQHKTEFVYIHYGIAVARIECKSQHGPGSIEEKFEHWLKNARDFMPEPSVWFVMECPGARPEAIEYFKKGELYT